MEEVLELPPGTYYYRDQLVLKVRPRPNGGINTATWYRRYKSPRTGKPTETALCCALNSEAYYARGLIKTQREWPRDPVQANRDRKARFKTFGEVADSWIKDKNLTGGRLYVANLYLKKHCADLSNQHMANIDANKIISVLQPQIRDTPVQARRILDMLRIVFDYAIGWNWYTGHNPAQWKGIHETRWPKTPSIRNHPAMPFTQIPTFMKELRAHKDAVSAVALELLILTACRTDEILGLRWDEIHWDEQMIVLPPRRTKQGKGKNGKEHRIPLTTRIIELLRQQERDWNGNDLVFAGQRQTGLGEKSMFRFLRDSMDIEAYTIHGFRSTFSNWAYETTQFEPHIIELSMGHTWGSKVTRAYFRGDALEKRRAIMEAWSNYCDGTASRPAALRIVKAS
jgi:integrase